MSGTGAEGEARVVCGFTPYTYRLLLSPFEGRSDEARVTLSLVVNLISCVPVRSYVGGTVRCVVCRVPVARLCPDGAYNDVSRPETGERL